MNTLSDRSLLVSLVAEYNVLLENYEVQQDLDSEQALEDFLDRFPGVPNYDSQGNWIGSVALENGCCA